MQPEDEKESSAQDQQNLAVMSALFQPSTPATGSEETSSPETSSRSVLPAKRLRPEGGASSSLEREPVKRHKLTMYSPQLHPTPEVEYSTIRRLRP